MERNEYIKLWNKQNPEKRKRIYNNWLDKNPDYHKNWKKNNKSKMKQYDRKINLKKFGLTEEQYNQLFILQKGLCKICNCPQRGIKINLCVDHNHKNNKIRGLLCSSCNRAIGLLKDDFNIVLKASKYVELEGDI